MRKPLRSGKPRHHGRQNLPRDNAKLIIIKYLLSKDKDSAASMYELLHHAGIASYDYTFLKQLLIQMHSSGWIKVITLGSKGKEKSNYLLSERGRQLILAVKSFEKNHPILDLDVFSGI